MTLIDLVHGVYILFMVISW